MLISMVGKILSRVILNRLKAALDSKLGKKKLGRSSTDQTVTYTHYCGTVVGKYLFCRLRKTLGQCQQRCFMEVTLLLWSTREDNSASVV